MNLDVILLAMLTRPANGYDLKAAFDKSANHFWPAELSQIYRTLKRLEESGFLKSRTELSERGPRIGVIFIIVQWMLLVEAFKPRGILNAA